MEYITRNLTSDPGLDQREALMALQSHPSFKKGSIVASIRKRGSQWFAEVLEPKTAEFPPVKEDGGDEGGASDSSPKSDAPPSDPDGDGDNDSSPSGDIDNDAAGAPKADDKGGDKPESKGSTEEAILHTLTQILHALQGGGAPDVPGGPDALSPGGPPGGPPAPKGPAGPPPPGAGPAGAKSKFPPRPMKPGDTPPGGTPVGAPAFSHTHTANPLPAQGTPVPTGAETGPVGQQAAGTCPQCGGPQPCPVHGAGLSQAVASYSSRASTITLTKEGTDIKSAIEEARPVVENFGYKVKQAKRGDGVIHILASRR